MISSIEVGACMCWSDWLTLKNHKFRTFKSWLFGGWHISWMSNPLLFAADTYTGSSVAINRRVSCDNSEDLRLGGSCEATQFAIFNNSEQHLWSPLLHCNLENPETPIHRVESLLQHLQNLKSSSSSNFLQIRLQHPEKLPHTSHI